MLNKVIVMGRLVKDPKLRHTQNGFHVAGFSLAVDRNYSKDKEKVTDFFDIVAWQNRAEFVYKYFAKGQLVCVEGRLQQRKWTDKDGTTRYAVEIVADSTYFAGSKKNDDQSQNDNSTEFDPFAEETA